MRRLPFAAAALALVLSPLAARADAPAATPPPVTAAVPPSAAPSAPKTAPAAKKVVVVRKAKPKKVEPPPLPAPELRLTLDAPSPDAPWTLRAENAGKVPLQIAADARYLEIEAAIPDAKKPLRCALPSVMRPADADDRALVVPPGGAYVEKLDPRLFCFGAKKGAALAAGVKLTPHLVTPRETIAAVGPIEGLETPLAAEHDWAGVESTVGPAPAAQQAAAPRASGQPLAISSSAYVDATRAADVVVTVTARNVSSRPITFLLRPDTLTFDVAGPSGVSVTDPSPTVKCANPPTARQGAIAEVYTTLRPGQQASLSVMLAALCPERTLEHPGVYAVRAKLDTQPDPGAKTSLHAFEGEVTAEGSSVVRVQTTRGPARPAPRPRLAEAAAPSDPPPPPPAPAPATAP